MSILIGKWATAIRQSVDRLKEVKGVAPHLGAVDFTPAYSKNIFRYTDPTDVTVVVGEDGGEFEFRNQLSVKLLEIQIAFGKLGTVNVDIVEPDGSLARPLFVGVSSDDVRLLPVDAYVLPGQKLVIYEDAVGLPIVGVSKHMTVYAIQEGQI